jgi:hypothetical protein
MVSDACPLPGRASPRDLADWENFREKDILGPSEVSRARLASPDRRGAAPASCSRAVLTLYRWLAQGCGGEKVVLDRLAQQIADAALGKPYGIG